MSKKKRIVYQEFGATTQPEALERATPNLPPEKQDLRVQLSRKGRKGKSVTEITGFQTSPDTLKTLLKKIKSQCGTGGTVKDSSLEIQGDCREKVLSILQKEGYIAKISGG
ncbi:MAG: translation initiation factor [Jaaginema sp. PMC 1079.18]|nr:translation initiation factor [Jaaginema sp. PMC 1080.18]MEC4852652.1 translation initiation factor [Jaaginema sp. PMC 1079.18]MEC4868189.1 translation initiation factor [Jaaginema sp. PMC 1078.18]